MRHAKAAFVLPVMLGLCATQAHAGLTIIPTYDPSITSLSNAAAIEATIQTTINVY